jgi:hypothetical protein
MDAIRKRWRGSELWWAHDDELRAAGRDIAQAFRSSEESLSRRADRAEAARR